MELEVREQRDEPATEVGSYFVSNYPPFSTWSADHVPAVLAALDRQPGPSPVPLGLYMHIPFCRKRCKFCYFRVYTDKNSRDIETYLEALTAEAAAFAAKPAFRHRELTFVYFGGGTPSFLSSEQLKRLIDRTRRHWVWDSAPEVTFECEPGTLKKSKLQAIQEIGTTRLSLGIEHFDDDILALNGRAHRSPEIHRAYQWAREVGFAQINVDLIAGMLGDTETKWKETVETTLALQPDSLTVYQMELPHNTVIAREAKASGTAAPVADWATKRAWVDHAFRRFEDAGYVVSSAYTVIKPSPRSRFLYRDSLWHGADMIGTGVSSFSHVGGFHFQNVDTWEEYFAALQTGDKQPETNGLPIARALPLTDHQRLVREMILQLKLGRLEPDYFDKKFDADILTLFADAFASLVKQNLATINGAGVTLSRAGLLRVDELLPRFFEPQFRDIRYT
ncbi:MAG: coproporphyrinogen-III oxidase family protein [Phycisphaerae bacterium]